MVVSSTLRNNESQDITIIIDGASRGNPGEASLAVCFLQGDKIIASLSRFIGTATNNQAEWLAFLHALRFAKLLGLERIKILTDSMLLFQQWKGSFKTKAPQLKQFLIQGKELSNSFQKVDLVLVPRKMVRIAHNLAHRCLKTTKKEE